MMYVHPELTGRGVASAPIAAAEQHARSQGLMRIYSDVSLTARPFLERKCFRVVEPERAFRNGPWFDGFKMEKQLIGGADSQEVLL